MFPDFDGLGDLNTVIGALLTFALVLAVLMRMLMRAIIWAVVSARQPRTASKARTGLLVVIGAAALAVAGWRG